MRGIDDRTVKELRTLRTAEIRAQKKTELRFDTARY